MYYTTWGAYSTLILFFLLILVSIQKFHDHSRFLKLRESSNYQENQEKFVNSIFKSDPLLFKLTAWFFQWAFISELVITFCFWLYLFVLGTDVSKMSSQQVRSKIVFDLFIDVENYDHSLPLALLLLEYSMNLIPFYWSHWILIFILQIIYITLQALYSLYISHKAVYNGIDWNKDFKTSLVKSCFPLAVSFACAIIVIPLTRLKIWIFSHKASILV